MPLRRFLLLLLILPGLALGPGWSLRFCTQQVLGTEGCCGAPTPASCCPDEERSAPSPLTEIAEVCDGCCIDVETSAEPPARVQPTSADELERAHLAAWAVAREPSEPCASLRTGAEPGRAPRPPPPAAPGRSTPLPLRL